MKIKASLLMPVLAALTVMAIVSTGIALGQLRNGAPWATLLSSMPRLESAAAADLVTVADSGPLGAGGGQTQQPLVQLVSSIRIVQTGAKPAAVVQEPRALAATPSPPVSKDSSASGVSDDDSDLGTPADGPLPPGNGPGIGAGAGDLLQGSTNDRSEDDPKVEVPATQLAAVDFGQETESVSELAEEDHAETAPSAGDD